MKTSLIHSSRELKSQQSKCLPGVNQGVSKSIQTLSSHTSTPEFSAQASYSTPPLLQNLSSHTSTPEFQRNVTPNGSQRLASGEPRLCTFLQKANREDSVVLLLENLKEIPPSIYFGGCANGSIFYIGVYKAMIEKWGADFPEKTTIYGDSAGIILVLGITQKMEPEFISKLYHDCGINSPHGILSGMKPLEDHCIKKLVHDFEDPSFYEKVNGKIFIGGSTFFANHFWKSQWNSNEELYNSIVESFNIPLLCNSKNKRHNGVLDGGFVFSGKDLPHGDDTLYVADDPYSDIFTPMNYKELFYPHLHDECAQSIQRGYDAFMKWDGKYKKKVGFRKSKYSIQCILWVLYLIEIFIQKIKICLRM